MKKTLILTLLTLCTMANAQTYGDEGPTLTPNAFGLVYEDAISENVPGKVNLHRVNYKIDGIDVVAHVYTPAGYDPKGSYAAVVVAHPNGCSKDQVAGLYAQKLSEAGFVTIAFDARYQGESGGEPRRTDKPANRMGDIMGAVDFIQNYPGVDPERIGAFGICGGGGYTFATAQVDKRIKAVGTLSLFNTGDVRRNGYMRTQKGDIAARQRDVSLARQKEAAGAEPELAGFMNWTPEEARQIKVDLYRDGYFYYGVTHKTPNAPGTFSNCSTGTLSAHEMTVSSLAIPSIFASSCRAKLSMLPMTIRAEVRRSVLRSRRSRSSDVPNVKTMPSTVARKPARKDRSHSFVFAFIK